jgi:hypothetical protein
MRSKSSFLLREIIKINSDDFFYLPMAWEGRVRKTTEEDVAHTVEGANKALFTQAQKKREEREQSEPRRVNKNRKMISSHLYHRASSLEFVSLSLTRKF